MFSSSSGHLNTRETMLVETDVSLLVTTNSDKYDQEEILL